MLLKNEGYVITINIRVYFLSNIINNDICRVFKVKIDLKHFDEIYILKEEKLLIS